MHSPSYAPVASGGAWSVATHVGARQLNIWSSTHLSLRSLHRPESEFYPPSRDRGQQVGCARVDSMSAFRCHTLDHTWRLCRISGRLSVMLMRIRPSYTFHCTSARVLHASLGRSHCRFELDGPCPPISNGIADNLCRPAVNLGRFHHATCLHWATCACLEEVRQHKPVMICSISPGMNSPRAGSIRGYDLLKVFWSHQEMRALNLES
ncbi:hypothetical protein BJX70DRAFT_218878 [Aspergillus crustosus]